MEGISQSTEQTANHTAQIQELVRQQGPQKPVEPDTRTGYPKKNQKKYLWDDDAEKCAIAYMEMIDSGDYQTLEDFCRDHATDHGLANSTLYKKVSQNRDNWDKKRNYFRCKPKIKISN